MMENFIKSEEESSGNRLPFLEKDYSNTCTDHVTNDDTLKKMLIRSKSVLNPKETVDISRACNEGEGLGKCDTHMTYTRQTSSNQLYCLHADYCRVKEQRFILSIGRTEFDF